MRHRLRAIAACLAALAALMPASASGAQGRWASHPSMPVAAQEVASAALDGKLYVAGGFSSAGLNLISREQWRHDARSGEWRELLPLPERAHHLQAVAVGNRVYYLAGLTGIPFEPLGAVWAYRPRAGRFIFGSSMPPRRARGAAGVAAYRGRIYVAGGQADGAATPLFDVYDPGRDRWRALPDLPRAREHLGGAFVGDRLYAVGGRTSAGPVLTTDVYDVSRGRWLRAAAPIPTGRGGLAVTASDGLIWAIGGEGDGIAHPEVEVYDPARDDWRPGPPMPTPRHGIQAPLLGGRLWVAGGGSAQGYAPSAAHESLLLP